MAHKYEGPKDRTNPLAYVPIAIAAVLVVAFVFASGFGQGLNSMLNKPATQRPAILERPKPRPNIQALAQPTDELVAEGRSLYGLYCASCHGDDGYGKGEKGLNLNPPPQNFRSMENWMNGHSVAGFWQTLEEGIAGTSMASYSLTPAEERIKIIHFIRETWVPEPAEITDADIAALPAGGGTGGGGAIDVESEGPSLEEIQTAMVSYRSEPAVPQEVEAPLEFAAMPGSDLYNAACASCHGPGGGGQPAVKVLTNDPYIRIPTGPFWGSEGEWLSDPAAFGRIVTGQSTMSAMHDFATLTRQDVSELYDYVQALTENGGTQ